MKIMRKLLNKKFFLVNAHTHLELTDKDNNFNEKLYEIELWDWIIEIVKKKRKYNENDFEKNIIEGEKFLLAHNNNIVGDIRSVNPERPLFYNEGLSGIIFFEVLGYEEEIFQRKWSDFEKFFRTHKNSGKIGLSIHSLYTTSPKKAKDLINFARKNGLRVAIHMGEKKEESDFLLKKKINGIRKIFKNAVFEDYGFKSYGDIIDFLDLSCDTILIHCTQFNKDDWKIVKRRDIPVVLCPRSNFFFTGSLPDIESVINLDIRWALGTDSLYTNKDIDVALEGRFLLDKFSYLKKIEDKIFYALTYGGLDVLGIDKQGF